MLDTTPRCTTFITLYCTKLSSNSKMSRSVIQTFVTFILVAFLSSAVAESNWKTIKCLVCKRVIEEIETAIQKVDPKKTIDIGTFRLDSDGNQRQTSVPYAYSEIHLMEVLEQVCAKFSDYTQVTSKTTGNLNIMRLVGENGHMNSDLSKYDIVPDVEGNTNLKYYCESIIEDHEDAILKVFAKHKGADADIDVCTKTAHLCSEVLEDEYQFEDHEEL